MLRGSTYTYREQTNHRRVQKRTFSVCIGTFHLLLSIWKLKKRNVLHSGDIFQKYDSVSGGNGYICPWIYPGRVVWAEWGHPSCSTHAAPIIDEHGWEHVERFLIGEVCKEPFLLLHEGKIDGETEEGDEFTASFWNFSQTFCLISWPLQSLSLY